MAAALPIIALGTTLLSTVVGTISNVQQAKFQANIAKFNEQINRENAQRAAFRSQVEAQDQDRISQALIGEEVARQAGSGLSLRSGSFALKRKSLKELARQDTLRIRQAGDVEVFNFLTDAAVNKAEASAAKKQGTLALISGGLNLASDITGSSLISSAATTRKAPKIKRSGISGGIN